MNTKHVIPLTAAVTLAAAATVPLLVDDPSASVVEASPRIVDLAPISVRPATEDAAYYQSREIVDLPTVVVYPDTADRASLLAGTTREASLACRC